MSRFAKPALAAALIVYLVLHVLSLSLRQKARLTAPQRWIVALTGPLQFAVDAATESVGRAFGRYVLLTRTSALNERLAAERDRLQTELVRMDEVMAENERLRQLLDLRAEAKLKLLAARRIAAGASPYERTVRIDRGRNDGVAEGMAVLAPLGVVGQIVLAAAGSADVLLLIDPASAVDVVDQRSRARGIVRGRQMNELRFEYLFKGEDVEVGDAIVTSGLDGVYPPGFPVGTVASFEPARQGMFHSGSVRTSVDFNKLEEVAVVLEGIGP